jgi:hypothetical protein
MPLAKSLDGKLQAGQDKRLARHHGGRGLGILRHCGKGRGISRPDIFGQSGLHSGPNLLGRESFHGP